MATGEATWSDGLLRTTEPVGVVVAPKNEEIKARIAERWLVDGKRVLADWENITQVGISDLVMKAAKGEGNEDVNVFLGAVRWLSVNSRNRFEQWMGEVGFDEAEMGAIEQLAGAVGDKSAVVDAIWNFSQAFEGELLTIKGGGLVLDIVNKASLPGQSSSGDESEFRSGGIRREVGGGGQVGPPKRGDDKSVVNKARKVVATVESAGKQVVQTVIGGTGIERASRASILRSGCLGILAVGVVCLCVGSGIVGASLKGWGITKEQPVAEEGAEATVEPVYAEAGVAGDRQAAQGITERMFLGPGVGEMSPIDMFLQTYGTSTDKGRATRGESMLDELEKQGLFDREMGDVNKEDLKNKLMGLGYDQEDVEGLLGWLDEYLQNRDEYGRALQP